MAASHRPGMLVDHASLVGSALDAIAVLAPTSCSGCGEPDRALCASCRQRLVAHPFVTRIGADADPLLVDAGLTYSGVPRRVLLALKESGRTDAAAALAGAIRPVVAASLRRAVTAGTVSRRGAVSLVAVPSTRAAFRVRGYVPMDAVLTAAGLRTIRGLHAVRQTVDQAGLRLEERANNRTGSLAARRTVRGRDVIIVDDILTTGATLLEVRRALRAAGARVLGAAVIAYTERRRPP